MSMSPDEYVWEIKQFRHQKDQFFATSPDAPIPPRERQQFEGLRYFEPDPAYRVEAELIRFPAPEVVQLGTTTGRISQHYRYGEVRFTLGGQECRLTAYKSVDVHGETVEDDHELFLPFRDATSGQESYGAGRYLEVEEDSAGPGRVTLDFNLAYSPWCAYSEMYSCVLPPAENRLALPVRAGERSYHE
ncbi:MAG TPA: DUF1684 domain-containing protein [Ktedonobacterales bacterium]|nr:DUF1684 domain-containing protein [Ktedonobacterales bacterium]